MELSAKGVRAPDKRQRRHLALWFPFLPCERARRETAPPDPQPRAFALVGQVGNALRLTAVCHMAAALGLEPGLPLADARARHPDLETLTHDRDGDVRELDRLAKAMVRFTPLVTPDPPDGLLLDITGCAHLLGGEAQLVEAVLAATGYTTRHALADHAAAARALARHQGTLLARHQGTALARQQEAVGALPVTALDLSADAIRGLRRAGLNTIADLAARPMASIAARFGPGAVTALRRVLGEEDAPLDPLVHAAPLRFERRFAEPVALQATIAACFFDLLREAARVLEERGQGGRRFVLTLWRSDGARQRLDITTGLPTRDPAPVLRLFDERIAALADPLDPGFGYDRITLAVPVAEPLAASQPTLDGGERATMALAALIDRLGTRLGADRLSRLLPHNSHVPERAQRVVPAAGKPAQVRWPVSPVDEPASRPLLLFDPPQPVAVIAGVPDGPPQRFRWRGHLHEIGLAEGPERIAGEWWRRMTGHLPEHKARTRDYYRVEDSEGRRFWLFRHGLYDERGQPDWYIHGVFA